jgi:hypothetical protein
MSVFTDVPHSLRETEAAPIASRSVEDYPDLAIYAESLRDGLSWIEKAYESQEQGGIFGIM